MKRDPAFASVIGVFARYGYRKASMSDLADAANVSRQTLYNRFSTKQAVLDWAVEGISLESETIAIAALCDAGRSLEARIVGFFMEWMGAHTSLIHKSPHGVETFEMSKTSQNVALEASHDRCADALGDVLMKDGGAPSHAAGAGMAFALIMASKGLLIASADEAAFEDGMKRIVQAVVLLEE